MSATRKLLIVEDDSDLRESLVEQLELQEEFDLTAVGSAGEAMRHVKAEHVDLVILDVGLPDLDGQLRRISEWDGKVLVVNFWATWCPPCRREIPAFIELQETYGPRGVQFVGVAVDTPNNVSDFVDPMGINYPTLVGESDAIAIAKQYGNRLGVLPYTVVYVHRNELSYADAEAVIQPLL